MTRVGIEAMNAYCGTAFLDVALLVEHRGLDTQRFENLLMREKSVALPHEDPVTFAVNAAKPIVDALSPAERDRIELLITCTESGIDFGKSLSTYVHDYLHLNRNCRLMEVKNACYSGTAGFQMAVAFVASQLSPGAKALVVATDVSRFVVAEGGDKLSADWSFAEPSGGAGAVAVLVGEDPSVFEVDRGANGYYGYEVMDTCRPIPDGEAGSADLSLMSYLDCCAATFREYRARVPEADYARTFDYLAFHTPFGGMVKGAHRTMMRRFTDLRGPRIEEDFSRRVAPGLTYCTRVGNLMGATVFLSLLSTIVHAPVDAPRRIGCFSYGSGCCSEFYSGVVTPDGSRQVAALGVGEHLDRRHPLTFEEYERLFGMNESIRFGTRDVEVDLDVVPGAMRTAQGREVLALRAVKEFHREYVWL